MAPGTAQPVIEVVDIPTHGDKAKRRVHAAAVVALIEKYHPDRAVIERAQAMPDQGASSGFIYGRAVGALEACVEGAGVRLYVIESTAWKKYHGLRGGKSKEDSRQKAIMLYPGAHGLERKMDHNRAEAVLIAAYGATLQA